MPSLLRIYVCIALTAAACGDDAPSSTTTDTSADTSASTDTSSTTTTTSEPDVAIIQPPCNTYECVDGVASECGGGTTLTCGDFAASCTTFESSDGIEGWCDCGPLGEGESACSSDTGGVQCDDGLSLPFECIPGATCATVDGIADCFCDDAADGICPGDDCVDDPDCQSCTPACDGKECGANGCGGSCGTCAFDEACAGGQCACEPSCGDKVCGGDGCGGSCGACAGELTCEAGQCLAGVPENAIAGALILSVVRAHVTSEHIYFIGLGSEGQHHAYRCPVGGCADALVKISSAPVNHLYAEITVAGARVFWVASATEIWQADISGASPGSPSRAWSIVGTNFIQGLDSDGTDAFAVVTGVQGAPLWVTLPGDGTAPSASDSTLADSGDQLADAAFDVQPGTITAWVGRNEPRPIQSITDGVRQDVATASDVLKNGLVRLGSQIVWLDEAGVIRTCGVGLGCESPFVVTVDSGAFAITADADALYFVEWASGSYHVRRCSRLDLLASVCEPTTSSSSFSWAGARELQVIDGWIYGVGQQGALVRARL